MKTKIVKIIAAAVAVLLMAGVLFIYNAFCGNPISAAIAGIRIKNHIDMQYPGHHYQISSPSYDFKMGGYTCAINDPDSTDRSFSARYAEGKIYDTYEDMMNKSNVLDRLDSEFREALRPLIDTYVSGDDDDREFGFATIFDDIDIDRSRVAFDMKADPKQMPVDTFVTLCFRTGEEESFRRARTVAAELEKLGYRIDYYTYSDKKHYYEDIPSQKLLEATSPDELKPYLLPDEPKE